MAHIRGRIRLRSLADSMEEGAQDGVGLALRHVLQVSNTRVPVEEGDLQNSGRVEHDGTRGLVTYDSVYAARQHEELTWRHSDGRIAKYLEFTLSTERDAVRDLVGVQVRRRFGVTST